MNFIFKIKCVLFHFCFCLMRVHNNAICYLMLWRPLCYKFQNISIFDDYSCCLSDFFVIFAFSLYVLLFILLFLFFEYRLNPNFLCIRPPFLLLTVWKYRLKPLNKRNSIVSRKSSNIQNSLGNFLLNGNREFQNNAAIMTQLFIYF